MQDRTLAHAWQVDTFLAVILAIIEALDRQGIAECFDRAVAEAPWARQFAAASPTAGSEVEEAAIRAAA